jgi:mono/diheme cytochrome c family protein
MALRRVATTFWVFGGLASLAWGCLDSESKSRLRAGSTGPKIADAGPAAQDATGSNGSASGANGPDGAESSQDPEDETSETSVPAAADVETPAADSEADAPLENTPGTETPTGPEGGSAGDMPGEENKPEKPRSIEDIFEKMPAGADQLKVLCARPGQDKVRQVFCSPTPPTITGLQDLQKALGLGIVDPTRVGRGNNGTGGNAGFAFIAGSSSLVAKFTSSINPRLIMFSPPTGNNNPNLVALGFVRGDQFTEVIARDPSNGQLNFFLVKFEQECNEKEKGCTNADLLTPAIETNWKKITIYEDRDLANTIFDCMQCHQPNGPGTPKMLRMQELRNPWTHFFRNNNAGGQALIADYQAAHGTNETYAGIPGPMISSSEPADLETFLRDNGFGNQPNEFQTRQIEGEVRNSNPAQPADNSQMGRSATWNAAYDQFVRGLTIPPPYHDVKVTDPTKLASHTAAYVAVMNGSMPPDMMPDIRDIFPAAAMRDLGFGVKEGLSGAEIITQACAHCHNAKLDQTISRARFDVDLTKMSREEKDLAIARLKLRPEDPLRMPPTMFRTLTPEEIDRAVAELQK